MPQQIYTIELDGKQYDIQGDRAPTEAEARSAIGSMASPSHEPAAPQKPERTWTDTAVDLLPTAGGIAGSLIGGAGGTVAGMGVGGVPGAIGGAALGGGAGEAAKQLINRARGKQGPASMGQAAADIGIQGVTQAGAEVGGRIVGAGLRTVAKPLYQSVLKPSMAMRKEYPGLVQTALDHAIPVSKGGAEKAGALAETSRDAADALVADKQALLNRIAPGVGTIDPRAAVRGLAEPIAEARKLPVGRPQMQAIGDYGRAYLKEHPNPMSLTDAQASVRATDKFYDKAYRATMDRGNAVTAGNTAGALGINNETRQLLRTAVPKLQGQNAITRNLVGVQDAVENRVAARANNSPVGMQHLINAGLGGGVGSVGGTDKGVGTFLLLEALTNPATASRLAIGAAKAGSQGASAQAIRQALASMLASHSTDE